MWVDIIIVVIIIYTFVQGFRRGFIHTFIHTLGWVLAIILGFVWYPYVIDFLKTKTNFYESIHEKIVAKVSENAGAATESALDGFPEIIRDVIDAATNAIATSLADGLSTIIFNILGFLIIALAIKFILFIISSLFSKTSNEGFIGIIDGFFGFIAGGLKGIIVIYILLAFIVPITSLTGSEFIMDEIHNSTIGSYMYDNNILFLVFKNLLA